MTSGELTDITFNILFIGLIIYCIRIYYKIKMALNMLDNTQKFEELLEIKETISYNSLILLGLILIPIMINFIFGFD